MTFSLLFFFSWTTRCSRTWYKSLRHRGTHAHFTFFNVTLFTRTSTQISHTKNTFTSLNIFCFVYLYFLIIIHRRLSVYSFVVTFLLLPGLTFESAIIVVGKYTRSFLPKHNQYSRYKSQTVFIVNLIFFLVNLLSFILFLHTKLISLIIPFKNS